MEIFLIGFCVGFAVSLASSLPAEKKWMKYAYQRAYRQAVEDMEPDKTQPHIVITNDHKVGWRCRKCHHLYVVEEEKAFLERCRNCGCEFDWSDEDGMR